MHVVYRDQWPSIMMLCRHGTARALPLDFWLLSVSDTWPYCYVQPISSSIELFYGSLLQAYKCQGGRQVPLTPAVGQTASSVVAVAVPKNGKTGSPSAAAAAAVNNCTQLDCFCKVRRDT